ncbi:hypothetical protein L9F63_010077 [Diploptera punctata]|uniref:Ubiquitin carboxyl-terminal hydrolase n=1 Tax=Diploptera punctata TaxID=6984 RepID=A0AAD8AJU5_DIPPU|nr:hypothetical protein L9F63_010077 [Diploptera punctata]
MCRCYDCGCEIAAQSKKKLLECVEFVKRQEEAPLAPFKKKVESTPEKNGEKAPVEASAKNSSAALKNVKGTAAINNLPRVRGLTNLGNTCFFNAVLQCLAQTPFLLSVLQEMSEPGTKFSLPGNPDELPPLEGELGKWGSLTENLASTLIELQSSKCDVYNPQRLLNKLTQRFQQFRGGEQHDSHELLRHLLEGVRTEDLKRYQSSILHLFGLSEKCNPTEVEDEIRVKAKCYGRQASEMLLRPEQVFRGFLVSTLECQDCRHSSQRVESFLDLSLPVMADKPQPPVMRRKSNNDESFDVCGNVTENKPSNYQLKKEQRQARKDRKKQKFRKADLEQPTVADEIAAPKNSAESEQSDADVEDNVDQDTGIKGHVADVGESGYSSEKLGNDDSTVESPVSHLANGDSALASPASPADMDEPMSILLQDLQPACNGETSKELVVAIPSLCPSLGNPSAGSPLSPASNRETPSPVSSEVNIDCSSSISVRVNGECASPDVNGDFNRPMSRFAFCHDDDAGDVDSGEGAARYSPVEDECSKNLISDLCDNMNQLSMDYYSNTCTQFVLVNGCEEGQGTQLVGGEDKEVVCDEDTVGLLAEDADNASNVESGVSPSSDKNPCIVSNDDNVQDNKNNVSTCEMKTQTNAEVTNWSATVSPRYQCDDGECSIQSCLNQFMAIELMTGNNKVGCENCTQRQNQGKEGKMVCTNSTKQLLMKTPPAVLILHLKRFQVIRTVFRKVTRHVSFPLLLDISPICSAMCKDSLMMKPGQNKVLYALYGVVEHSGTLHGGHYVAYVKVRAPLRKDDPRWAFLPRDLKGSKEGLEKEEGSNAVGGTAEAPPGKWYFVSDSCVKEVREDRVLRSQAYLLFYERIW